MEITKAPKIQIYEDIDRELYVEAEIAAGNRVVYPKENELLIDIDTENQYSLFKHQIEALEKNSVLCTILYDELSRGGYPGRHIIVKLDNSIDLDPVKRIAFQAALGSDPMRELLSLLRNENEDKFPTLFIEEVSNV